MTNLKLNEVESTSVSSIDILSQNMACNLQKFIGHLLRALCYDEINKKKKMDTVWMPPSLE